MAQQYLQTTHDCLTDMCVAKVAVRVPEILLEIMSVAARKR